MGIGTGLTPDELAGKPVSTLCRPSRSQVERETGIEPVCTVLQTVASPLGHSTVAIPPHTLHVLERMTRLELATLTLAR